jgi:hypothetical protein
MGVGNGNGRWAVEPQAAASSVTTRCSSERNAPRRQAMKRAIETTATMIVDMALIWGVTPNLIEL